MHAVNTPVPGSGYTLVPWAYFPSDFWARNRCWCRRWWRGCHFVAGLSTHTGSILHGHASVPPLTFRWQQSLCAGAPHRLPSGYDSDRESTTEKPRNKYSLISERKGTVCSLWKPTQPRHLYWSQRKFFGLYYILYSPKRSQLYQFGGGAPTFGLGRSPHWVPQCDMQNTSGCTSDDFRWYKRQTHLVLVFCILQVYLKPILNSGFHG